MLHRATPLPGVQLDDPGGVVLVEHHPVGEDRQRGAGLERRALATTFAGMGRQQARRARRHARAWATRSPISLVDCTPAESERMVSSRSMRDTTPSMEAEASGWPR